MFNQPFKFHTPPLGPIVFEVSDLASDYGPFQCRSDAVIFAKRFILFSKMWLEAHGYSPVAIRIVPQWSNEKANYGYICDPQYDLRQAIFSDFLSPDNFGKPLHQFKGLPGAQTKDRCSWFSRDVLLGG